LPFVSETTVEYRFVTEPAVPPGSRRTKFAYYNPMKDEVTRTLAALLASLKTDFWGVEFLARQGIARVTTARIRNSA
jgi:hypothetical protein